MSLHIPVNNLPHSPTSYISPFLCSLLGPLERQLVMNLLWLETAVPAATMAAWITNEGRKYALQQDQ